MSTKIVKSYTQKTPQQIESQSGTVAFINWHKLKDSLASLVNLKQSETIEGIVVDETGISVKLTTNSSQA